MKKLLIAVALLIAFVSVKAITIEEQEEGQEIRQKLLDGTVKCAADLLRSIIAGRSKPVALQTYYYCASKHATLQDDEGKINKQNVKLLLIADRYPESSVPDIIDDCAVQKRTKEATAEYMINCMAKHAKTINEQYLNY